MALLGAFLLQTSCDIGGDTPAFGVGAVEASDTGIISRTHFTLRFSKWDLEVFDANTGAFTAKSTDIVIHAGDNEGRAVIGRVIQIRTAWGDKNLECTTDSSGDCSVTWNTDADSELAPDTNCVRVVAYTTGEEAYIEKNINDTTLDDLDAG